jgi:hypothetical protein
MRVDTKRTVVGTGDGFFESGTCPFAKTGAAPAREPRDALEMAARPSPR